MDNHPLGWPLLYETPLGMFCLYGKVLRRVLFTILLNFRSPQSFPGEGKRVLGTSRMTRIPSDPLAAWIESVVVHPELRGKGVGKYLMLKTEQGMMMHGNVEPNMLTSQPNFI